MAKTFEKQNLELARKSENNAVQFQSRLAAPMQHNLRKPAVMTVPDQSILV
jgi:hypothetical protein